MTPQERADFSKRYGLTDPQKDLGTGTKPKTNQDALNELDSWRASQQSDPQQSEIAPAEEEGSGLLGFAKDKLRQSGRNIKDTVIGGAKGVADTALSAGQLGSSILEKGYNETLGKLTGEEALPGAEMAKQAKQSEILKPQGDVQNFAYGAEKLGELFVPVLGEEKLAATGAKVLAKEGAGLLSKAGNVAKSVASKVVPESLDAGLKTAASTGSVDQGKDATLLTAALGTAFRGANEARRILGPEAGGKVINSLIKPLLKDFSYGKNPGLGIAKEGIVANSIEDLANKVGKARKQIGERIGETLQHYADKRIDVASALDPIDKAIDSAVKGGPGNSALVKRLQEAKQSLMFSHSLDEEGNIVKGAASNLKDLIPEEAAKLKTLIGDMTKWTGNQSDDENVNKALKKVYGNIRSKIEEVAPETKALNERYANLTTAESATKYRDKIVKRQDLIPTSYKAAGVAGTLTALGTGGVGVIPILAAGGGALVDKLLASTAAKTRLAKWFTELPPEGKQSLYKAVPALYRVLSDDKKP